MSLFRDLLIDRKRRRYYTEVEYMEADGTQYINTGLYGTTQSEIDIIFGMSSVESGAANNGAVFGGRTAQTANTFTMFKLASTTPQYFRFDYNGQKTAATASQITWNNTDKYRFQYNGATATTTNITTGESHSETISPPSSITTSPITLFAVNTNGTIGTYFKGRIYRYWYTDGTNTIDLIPVMGWDGKGYMYDKISGRLFGNAGTGDFGLGREIHYIDYLENITSQASLNYIPTKYTPTTNTGLEAKVRYTGGASGATWAVGAVTWWGIHYQGNGPKIGITNSSTDQYQVYTPYTAGNDITLKLDGSNVYADGTLVGSLTKTNATSTLSIFRYSTSANLSWVGRIYYLDIWDNNGYVCKFRPAIDSNGTAFLFDQVSHTIFDNAGSGNFLYAPVELEYLVANGGQYIDTGIQPTDDWGYHIRNTYTVGSGEQCAIGCMDSGNRFVGIYTSGYANQLSGAWGSFVRYLDTYTWNTGDILDIKVNYKNSRKMIVGSTELKDLTDIHISGTISNTIYLFARNYGSNVTKMNGKIYSVEITNGQNVVATYVPAFKDGVAGVLNKSNNTFLTNAGTGTFGYGRIIEKKFE